MKKCYDLRTNAIYIDALRHIVEHMRDTHIKGFSMGVEEFRLTLKKQKRIVTKENVEVIFNQRHYDDYTHRITGNCTIRFISGKFYGVIRLRVYATAKYYDFNYTNLIQGYIYTYMSTMVEQNETVRAWKYIIFPDHLSNFQNSVPETYVGREERFAWIDNEDFQTIDRIGEPKIQPEGFDPRYYFKTLGFGKSKKSEEEKANDGFTRAIEAIRKREAEIGSKRS